jgi:heterodisulfide reductase subunit A-like polyferredoxin
MNRRNFLGNTLIGGIGVGCSNSLLATESPSKDYPHAADVDVLVCGGGCSGVAAAVSAARHGAKVLLLERLPSVGGMATNALVNIWHCSDRKKQVIFGLVEETHQ